MDIRKSRRLWQLDEVHAWINITPAASDWQSLHARILREVGAWLSEVQQNNGSTVNDLASSRCVQPVRKIAHASRLFACKQSSGRKICHCLARCSFSAFTTDMKAYCLPT